MLVLEFIDTVHKLLINICKRCSTALTHNTLAVIKCYFFLFKVKELPSLIMHDLPQFKFSVLYSRKMWCMLSTPPRSTHHLALEYPSADIVHCPPFADKSVYRPSTALSAPQGRWSENGTDCHAGFFKAKFSFFYVNDSLRYTGICFFPLNKSQ